jgi:hypothetical protein
LQRVQAVFTIVCRKVKVRELVRHLGVTHDPHCRWAKLVLNPPKAMKLGPGVDFEKMLQWDIGLLTQRYIELTELGDYEVGPASCIAWEHSRTVVESCSSQDPCQRIPGLAFSRSSQWMTSRCGTIPRFVCRASLRILTPTRPSTITCVVVRNRPACPPGDWQTPNQRPLCLVK